MTSVVNTESSRSEKEYDSSEIKIVEAESDSE